MADLPIGMALAGIRNLKGLSQTDVEARTGMMRTYVSRVENGAHVPSLGNLCRFAEAFEIPAWRILKYAEQLRVRMEVGGEDQAP
jgi:transcriptional regulator with XRE-family HTH domain